MDLIVIQALGLLLLIGGLGSAYGFLVRPRVPSGDSQRTGLLMLLVLTMLGGFIGSIGWWTDNPASFSWDLPLLASRMLAAAAVAFGVLNWLALTHPTRRRVRLALLLLLTYLLPLAVAIVLFHLNRFDPSAPITYAFFLIIIGMILAGGGYLWKQPSIVEDTARDSRPTSRLSRGWLTGQAIFMGVWGIALFLTDSGPDLIWAWPGDLLTSRLIAVMLLTICAAAFYSRNRADTADLTHLLVLVYGLGVVAANSAHALEGKPIKPLYVAVFGVMAFISLGFWWQSRKVHEP
jgi:hypothetical protein